MVWRLDPTDRIPLDQLYGIENFFQNDLKSAEDYLANVKRWLRHVKPGKGFDPLKIAEDDIKVSKQNLAIVREAIKREIKRKQ